MSYEALENYVAPASGLARTRPRRAAIIRGDNLMYCPNCQGEFREGFVRCDTCDVDLVPALPPEPPHDLADLVPLLTTSDVPYLVVVKSLLASEGIQFLVQGEESLGLVTILPSGGSAPAALSATVFVPQVDLWRAREVVITDRSWESRERNPSER